MISFVKKIHTVNITLSPPPPLAKIWDKKRGGGLNARQATSAKICKKHPKNDTFPQIPIKYSPKWGYKRGGQGGKIGQYSYFLSRKNTIFCQYFSIFLQYFPNIRSIFCQYFLSILQYFSIFYRYSSIFSSFFFQYSSIFCIYYLCKHWILLCGWVIR